MEILRNYDLVSFKKSAFHFTLPAWLYQIVCWKSLMYLHLASHISRSWGDHSWLSSDHCSPHGSWSSESLPSFLGLDSCPLSDMVFPSLLLPSSSTASTVCRTSESLEKNSWQMVRFPKLWKWAYFNGLTRKFVHFC